MGSRWAIIREDVETGQRATKMGKSSALMATQHWPMCGGDDEDDEDYVAVLFVHRFLPKFR